MFPKYLLLDKYISSVQYLGMEEVIFREIVLKKKRQFLQSFHPPPLPIGFYGIYEWVCRGFVDLWNCNGFNLYYSVFLLLLSNLGGGFLF